MWQVSSVLLLQPVCFSASSVNTHNLIHVRAAWLETPCGSDVFTSNSSVSPAIHPRMKTSFYFVLWIIIYPVLGWIGNDTVTNNSFIFALIGVFAISWLINRLMKQTVMYEAATQVSSILEDVYTGNVSSFGKRLSREATIETITAAYLIITTLVVGVDMLTTEVSNWVALAVFGLFAFGSTAKCVNLHRANSSLKSAPTPEQCIEIANNTYNLNYEAYHEAHAGVPLEAILPPRPKYFNCFLIFSLMTAIIAALLGLLFIIASVIVFITCAPFLFDVAALSGMLVLYGFLAMYFGVKDILSTLQGLKRKPKPNNLCDNAL